MDWAAEIRAHLSRPGAEADDDIVLELAQHAQAAFEAARADGLNADEAIARTRALIAHWCADPQRLRRRPVRPPVVEPPPSASRGWTGFWQDVRYGARLLRRQPGFACVAALLVALGAGASATLLNIAGVVLWKPLPWPDADRIVRLSEAREGATHAFPNTITNATFLAWQDSPSTIESVATWGRSTSTMTMAGETAERFTVIRATAGLFRVLSARPALGALFTEEDQPAGRDHVIVLSSGAWQRHFGGRLDAIGKTLDLNGESYRVVGVMPPEFYFPDRQEPEPQGWVPREEPPVVGRPGSTRISVSSAVARLKPGVTAAQASAEATARGIAAPDLGMAGMAMFGTQGKPRVTATPFLEAITAGVRPALYILVAAVMLLLVVATANVAGMQLARATSRRREVAIRAALGATHGRLARQLLAENLVIGAIGGLGGWALSIGLHHLLPRFRPSSFPRAEDVFADWHVGALAMIASLVASVMFGAGPALLARKLRLVDALVEDSLAPVGGGMRSRLARMRGAIMAGQVTIAVLLLVAASLLGRSFVAMLQTDRGYDPSHVLTSLAPMGVLKMSGVQRAQLLDTIVERLEHTPGVVAAAGTNTMPLWLSEYLMSFRLPASAPGDKGAPANAAVRSVSPGYFTALGMRVIEGRTFTDADTRSSEPVAVVNRHFAHVYLNDHAVGVVLPLSFNPDGGFGVRIIGVVENVRQLNASDNAQPEIFNSYRQLNAGIDVSAPLIVVRTSGDPGALAPALRAIARDVNPLLALDSMMTMDDRLMTSLAEPRMYAVLLGAFAVAALVLCGVGLFGVLSYSVAQRTREIGIRAAMGARPGQIARLVARQGLAIASAGAAVGLVAALLLAKVLSTLLFGVTAHDPVTFVAVPAIVLAAAAIACYFPARRAASIDPLTALRR